MLTQFPNGISSFGIPVMGGGGIPAMFGTVYFVDYSAGLDDNEGKSVDKPLKTLSEAYDRCTTNKNDVILINGYSSVLEDAAILWTKNRIHVVGLGGGFLTGQRAKLELSATGITADAAANIVLSGVGNSFHNLKIINSGTHANSVSAVIDAGEATLWDNCSFMKLSDLDQTTVSDFETRADSTTYLNCEFGFDTLTQSVARPTLRIKGSGGTRMTHCRFIDCIFTCQSSTANKMHVLVHDTSALRFESIFKECIFIAAINQTASAVTLANAVTSVSGLVEGNLLFTTPHCSTTKFCTTADNIKVTMTPTSTANAFMGLAPST
jgi:hypothetical protein